jgi:hypothetical protein
MLKASQQVEAAFQSPEREMLLCCIRPHINAEAVKRIRAIAAGNVDWVILQTLADAHGLTSLLCRSLKLFCMDIVPDAVLFDLRTKVHLSVARRLLMAGELVRILNLLKQNGIQAVPFKGPVLSAVAYGDATLREFIDLDILIHGSDAQRARAVLASDGFIPEANASPFPEAPWMDQHYGLVHPKNHARVDLQWRVSPRYFTSSIDYHGLWGRLRPLSFMGDSVLCLAPQDQIAILCEHGLQHCWDRLILISDLVWLISSEPQVDWGSIVQSAIGNRPGRSVLLGFSLAHQFMGLPIPEEIRSKMDADRRLEPLVTFITQSILFAKSDVFDRADRPLFRLRAAECSRDKMLYGLGLIYRICTPNMDDRTAVPLPRILHFLYYPIRLVRLALVAGRWAIRRPHRRER